MTYLLDLCRKKGTDKHFREWIQRQRSCISGQFSEYLPETGEGRCVAAYVRRAATSGTGFKAEYSCVPLTQAEHLRQHLHGETSLCPKAWWDAQLKIYLKRWIES